MPEISVVLCVYNGLPYLHEAMTSILGQTFADFEVLFLNDGSTDGSKEVMLDYAAKDSRIRYFEQPNQGLTKSLNRCLGEVRGNYIARHDADDYSDLFRFQKQVTFLRANPQVGILGTHFAYIDDDKRITRKFGLPETDERIRPAMLRGNQFAHGSVMLRADVLRTVGKYSEAQEHQYIEDYEYWCRIMRRWRGANIPEILYYYRPNRPGSVCMRFGNYQKRNHFQFVGELRKKGLNLEAGR